MLKKSIHNYFKIFFLINFALLFRLLSSFFLYFCFFFIKDSRKFYSARVTNMSETQFTTEYIASKRLLLKSVTTQICTRNVNTIVCVCCSCLAFQCLYMFSFFFFLLLCCCCCCYYSGCCCCCYFVSKLNEMINNTHFSQQINAANDKLNVTNDKQLNNSTCRM